MPKKLTTEEFITRAVAKHGSRYDYSMVRYENTKKSVSINDMSPEELASYYEEGKKSVPEQFQWYPEEIVK